MQNRRENFLLSGCVCICIGAIVFFGVNIAAGGILGLSGMLLFLIGMSTPSEMGMSEQEIREWLPSAEALEDAGKVMYRVDTTIDQPIKTSILCGSCSHIEVIDGPRPSRWVCPKCDMSLWEEE